jgi:hypothetical protein
MQATIERIENTTQHNAALVEQAGAALASVDKQAEGILDVTAFFATERSAVPTPSAQVRKLPARPRQVAASTGADGAKLRRTAVSRSGAVRVVNSAAADSQRHES